MTETSGLRKVVVVLGDVNVDKILYRIPRSDNKSFFNSRYGKGMFSGGAVLVQEILKSTLLKSSSPGSTPNIQQNGQLEIIGYKEIEEEAEPKDKMDNWPETVTVLELFPKDERDRDEKRVYRIIESYGWIQPRSDTNEEFETVKTPMSLITKLYDKKLKDLKACEALVIINDKGLGFNEFEGHEAVLENLLKKFKEFNSHILISLDNCSKKTFHSKLWQKISTDFKDNTTVVVTASALRAEGLLIHVATSLEKTAEELRINIGHEVLKELRKCKHLVLSFAHFHVMHWNRDATTASYYFPPLVGKNIAMERLFENSETFGSMAGYRTVLFSALAHEIAKSMEKGSEEKVSDLLSTGIKKGIRLCRNHLLDGFAKEGFHNRGDRNEYNAFEFLFRSIDELSGETEEMPLTEAHLWLDGTPNWSRITNIRDDCGDEKQFNRLLTDIVIKGLRAVSKESSYYPRRNSEGNESMLLIPYAEFGKLLTANRQEIERFSDMYFLMQKYMRDKTWKTPLCLAVFGPPGSGKSFAMKQIMKSIQKSEKDPLVYNLSQFTGIDDLTTAFHQTQDRALAEEVPLIIFDEFDSKFNGHDLGWLKYFLEPMQDGTFRARGYTFLVGRAIFVFTGGIHENFKQLKNKMDDLVHPEYKDAKLPDFISRLKGHLDILGIDSAAPEVGVELMFRRAVILRSILENNAKCILHQDKKTASIDREVIMGFLKIPRYKHGTRSMEAIIQMSLPDRGEKIIASSLPAREQLNMHVDADAFLNIIREEASIIRE